MAPSTTASEWDDTQTAILDAAIRCVYKRGFQKLTTRCIADEAGVNEVTIFRRFSTKAAVLDAMFAREAQSVANMNLQYTGDREADFMRIVETLWTVSQNRQSIIPIILIELPRNPALREHAQHSLKLVGQLVQLVQQYQDEGQLKAGSPLMAFSALIGPLVFASLVESVMPQISEVFDLQQYVHLFLCGYGSTTT